MAWSRSSSISPRLYFSPSLNFISLHLSSSFPYLILKQIFLYSNKMNSTGPEITSTHVKCRKKNKQVFTIISLSINFLICMMGIITGTLFSCYKYWDKVCKVPYHSAWHIVIPQQMIDIICIIVWFLVLMFRYQAKGKRLEKLRRGVHFKMNFQQTPSKGC